jgi:hypothetical protein
MLNGSPQASMTQVGGNVDLVHEAVVQDHR